MSAGEVSVRLQAIEEKVSDLVNVVRLLQHYTEAKDRQYEMKVCSLHETNFNLRIEDLERANQQLKTGLRNELNAKLDTTMTFLKSFTQRQEEQLTFSLNNVDNEMARHKMLVEREFQLIRHKIGLQINPPLFVPPSIPLTRTLSPRHLKTISPQGEKGQTYQNGEFKTISPRLQKSQISQKSRSAKSRSELSVKSKKKGKSKSNRSLSPAQKKKIKDQELREAIRRKKEHKEKLKRL